MRRGVLLGVVLVVALGVPAASIHGDEFDRIEGEALAALLKSSDAKELSGLTMGQIDALPRVLRDARSTFLAARTGQGNVARLLVSHALRKTPGGQGAPLPVLLIERFDTFESGNLSNRLARGRDVLLFDGFEFDLDSGQVVPAGQGSDLTLELGTRTSPILLPARDAKLFSIAKAPPAAEAAPGRTSPGRSVLPRDFAGRYRLFANGQWSGTLDMKVAPEGAVTGRFRSDLNGTSYAVSGQVAADVPQKVAFTVTYPRTKQEFEGLIWTEGKGAMAGTMTMLDRAYGFFALREGAQFAPEGEEIGPVAREASKPGRRTVTVRKGQYTLDGQPRTDQELTDALRKALVAEPATWVLLQVPADESYASVGAAYEVIAAAGVTSIRVAPADPDR